MNAIRAHWITTEWHERWHQEGCFTCGNLDDLERAHLVDRCFGGLDHCANLIIICHACHRKMPSFEGNPKDSGIHHPSLLWTLIKKEYEDGYLEVRERVLMAFCYDYSTAQVLASFGSEE